MNYKTRKERFVVIGGCAAGMSAASKAKRLNPNLEVLAFEKTAHVSYSACGIPYFISDIVRHASDLISITPEEFRTKRGIEVFINHEVVDVKPVKRLVTVVNTRANKEFEYTYDKLLIAVGGQPRIPDALNKSDFFTIQTLEDGIRIKEYLNQNHPASVLIVGGGYIAMEMAEACRQRGLDVFIVEQERTILTGLENEIVAIVTAELARQNVKTVYNTSVKSIQSGSGNLKSVELQNGGRQNVGLILVCAGLLPNTKIAQSAGVRLGSTGAIAVDWKMKTTVPNIYAAGDCVEVKNIVSGKPDYIPLGTTANKQGRVAGENVGGGTGIFNGVVGTSVFKTFDLEVAKTGLNLREATDYGFNPGKATITEKTKAGYYPGAQPVTITVIFDRGSGRLLGAQMVGTEGVSKRIDIFALGLVNKMSLQEMQHLDLSYAPPFAPVWDPVLVALNVARSKLEEKSE